MKTITAAAAMLLLLCSTVSTALPGFSLDKDVFVSSSIVMVDDVVMNAQTGNPGELITNIKVFDSGMNLVHEVFGCGNESCDENLSSLGAGTYFVRVTTDMSNNFTDYVTVN